MKTRGIFIFICLAVLFLDSCLSERGAKDHDLQEENLKVSRSRELNKRHLIANQKTGKERQVNESPVSMIWTRYVEFPGDAQFNGAPMTEQLNLQQVVLEKVPDTLASLSKRKYEDYKHFYPKSIACDFEGGTSNEFVHYPKRLLFRYECFENELSRKPYLIKEILIERDQSGELYVIF